MNAGVLLPVLRELGVLFAAPGVVEALSLENLASGAPPVDIQAADHVFFAHTPLWSFEPPHYAYPFAVPGLKKLFEVFETDPGLDAVLDKTGLAVFFGAADTPALRRWLARPDARLIIFETDPARLARFAASVTPARLARRVTILLGPPDAFKPSVAELLPPELFAHGFPVCYALPGCAGPGAAQRQAELAELAELAEVLFYRHRMYGLSGQANARGLPVRPLARGMFYDQQLHFYDNAPDYLRHPDLRPLRQAFAGETAVLVAAGPDLPNRLEYLRAVREHAVLIAVNNALKPLAAAGIHPHFVVANDTSVATGQSWEGLPPLRDVSLVAHCLADLGRGIFGQAYLFGNCQPELFGQRPGLRLHGSVITTAFSLARHMGCARCVLAGAQLCSPDPWTLSYSRGSIHGSSGASPQGASPQGACPLGESQARPLTNAWPQLVPVRDMTGATRYTTLNFLDAAHWLRDEIRTTGLPCVSLTRETILHGPGLTYAEDCPVSPTGRLPRRLAALARISVQPPAFKTDPAQVTAMLRAELRNWEAIAQAAPLVLAREDGTFLLAASQLFKRFEQNNVSYLVQRYADFDNQRFHAAALAEGAGPESRAAGLRYYLEYVGRMAEGFVALLRRRLPAVGRS
ncbi:MAG: hypothetical protein AUJ49_01240 [Desulfovibrionaceae bacterium CG1_02_65_16]|nr:MAG: hypothetical protein AUJ49_01240 [Desulfovibrionaceae bacterium CG1_02_65_16]